MFKSKLNIIVLIFISLFSFESRQMRAQSASICQGDSALLQLNCTYVGTLQWQQSPDLITWSNIAGAILNIKKVLPVISTYYRAVVTNGTCQLIYSDTAIITVNPIPPPPTITVSDNCENSILTASGYTGTLLWSTGQTINPITINSSGTYTVTQTENGCIGIAGSATAAILPAPPVPIISVVDNCGNSILTASGFTGTLLWSTGQTVNPITVNSSGVYTVTQTINACVSDPASVTALISTGSPAPIISVVDNCMNSILTASGYTGTLLWNTGQTVNPIIVGSAGTYTVTQTVNGCTSAMGSGIAAPMNSPAAPSISVIDNCGSSTLTASGFTGTLLWSTGQTVNPITVNSAGTYTVTQTIAGCTSVVGNGIVAPVSSPPAPSISVIDNCGYSTLTASGFTGTLLWSTGQIVNPIIVNSAGTYTVIQMINGCSSATASATAAPTTGPSAPLITVVDNCGNSTLTASGFTGNLLWNTGQTINPIIVNSAGTYTVVQTINGCSSSTGSGIAAPIAGPLAPSIAVTDNCGNSILTASGFTGTLLWSTGQTINPITVNSAGTYTVIQIVNGCNSVTNTGIAAPSISPSAPLISVVDTCGHSTLTASGITGTFLWSTGQTTNPIMVSSTGTYTITQTVNGCTSLAGSATSASLPYPTAPIITVVNNCGNSTLTASSFTGTLLWSTGETINPITVNSAGTTTVIQTLNGCKSTSVSGTSAPLNVPLSPTTGTNTASATQIVWNWTTVAGATGYKWNTVNTYSSATDVGTGITYTQTGLTCNTAYTLYVWAYNGCGNCPVTILTLTTSACCTIPLAPTAGINTPSVTQIVWNWNASVGATGYQWSTTNTYPGVGVNVVASPTYTQTGLTCNTPYTLYIWAYNSCGNSSVTILNQTTSSSCCSAPSITAPACTLSAISSNKKMFITSTTYNGNLGGLAGADAICQVRAAAGSLSGCYKAWLSDGSTSASTRLTHATGAYVKVDGVTVIANNWISLISGGALLSPIDKDEFGILQTWTSITGSGAGCPNLDYGGTVWVYTNTTNSGASGGCSCSDWTSCGGIGRHGYGGNINGWWTETFTGGIWGINCDQLAHLYCVEQ